MNKLKTTMIAACSLVLGGVGTSALADADNFAGPYVGLSVGGYGLGVDGNSTSTALNSGGTDNSVQVGKVAAVSGAEIGYALPLGGGFLVDIGATYLAGEAKLDYVSDDLGSVSADVSLKVDDLITYYIAPTLVLSDTSSIYAKLGLSEADISVSGDVTTPADLSGTTWAIGTRTVLESGIFVRSEAGYTDYNGISSHGKGNTQASTTSYSAKPTTAYGQISMGFRF